jgi:hypothetical protein
MTAHTTKTWFDGDKVVTQEIPESEIYKQEPRCAVIVEVFGKDWRLDYMSLPVGKHKLYTQEYVYTAPPQRQWVGLTDEEVLEEEEFINHRYGKPINHSTAILMDFVKQVEAKLKEKNT